MDEQEVTRRLTAILSADIAGYSRLMGEDELGTLQQLKRHQATVFPLVPKYEGRIIDVAGDGILAEFPSAVGAVQCALEIQRAMAASNAGVPEPRRLQFRIGVNLGDVIHDGERIYGDGINVAARIQALARPGGLVVSQTVFDQVRNRIAQPFQKLGAAKLKNIRDAVTVHEAVIEGMAPRSPWQGRWRFALGSRGAWFVIALFTAALVALAAWQLRPHPAPSVAQPANASAIKSLAILPFRRLDARADDEYLGVGLADALVTTLGNVQEIIVRPTSAVLRYNKEGQDPLAAGREQGVDALMEGSIQRAGQRLRVNVRLLRVSDGASLWAAKYDEEFSDVFRMQDSIAEQATRALLARLTGEQRERLSRRYTDNVQAYELYLQGRYQWNKFSPDGFRNALERYEKALVLDPNYALAYTGIASAHAAMVAVGAEPYAQGRPKAIAAANRAIEIDDRLAEGHLANGASLLLLDWNRDAAERELRRTLELNPNMEGAYSLLGYVMQARGRVQEAIEPTRRAVQLNPVSPLLRTDLASAYYYAGQWDAAIREYEEMAKVDAHFLATFFVLGQALERKGDSAGAIKRCEDAIRVQGRDPVILSSLAYAHASAGHRAEALAVAREMEERFKREHFNPTLLVLAHVGRGDRDRAFHWLETAFREHDVQLLWIPFDPQMAPFRADPRFQALLRAHGF